MASAAGSEEACREIRRTCGAPRRLGLLLAPRSPAERQQIRAAYRARFGEDLAATLHGTLAAPNTNQVDELSKLLYLWALEPAERDAVVAREAVEGGVTAAGYRALVEVFTRRKQDQLFFTKQAYALLLALAASRRSHHDDLSQHVAKCDARRLHDTKNSGAGAGSGSVVDEAVILEMFSKRSIPQLRLAFCSYKHIYGHDYTKASGLALKINGSGEFEGPLRVVVKCIYNPSKYYSKLLHRSMLPAATDTRMVTRAILGSDDVGIDEIRSAFQSSYGKSLAEYIQENLPGSDYRDFLVAVASASVAQ
ncbi:Annexin A13 [Zea mays]|uniref:Annexin A13 n=2 Tax=Zea mays TaxID=4577 RepID=A0A3L6G076_MAIZE|nr:Nuclear pore complex protein NUP58 [Zea mays]PWZ40508.1 Annexin A13 [Zea mays]